MGEKNIMTKEEMIKAVLESNIPVEVKTKIVMELSKEVVYSYYPYYPYCHNTGQLTVPNIIC